MQKMVGDAKLPVLQDTDETDFKQTYSANSAKSHLIFDREGCLLKFEDMPSSRTLRDSLELLVPYVREAL